MSARQIGQIRDHGIRQTGTAIEDRCPTIFGIGSHAGFSGRTVIFVGAQRRYTIAGYVIARISPQRTRGNRTADTVLHIHVQGTARCAFHSHTGQLLEICLAGHTVAVHKQRDLTLLVYILFYRIHLFTAQAPRVQEDTKRISLCSSWPI